jgi:feruloyl esterase
MQRITPQSAGRTIVFMLACAAILSLSGRQAKAADADMLVDDAARRCAGLGAMKAPASAFALPTGSAVVTEALLIAPDSTTAAPEYCRVRATIAAAQASDPSILYQVNLPTRWNFKTVLYGGGGLNGVLIEATGAFKAGDGLTSALARGYVTYGSDSGHQTPGNSFYENAQATANYSHEAVKRTKDLTTAFVDAYYGKSARRNYQIGGSKGGQEGLQAAQRYYADFNGVVSYYPAAQSQSLNLAWNRLWHYAFNTPGGALNTAKQALLARAVLAACDTLDGVADGLVSDTAGCRKAFNVTSLRCPGGVDTGNACLSDPQIAALNAAATPLYFAFPMPNGVESVGPWPAFILGDLETWFGDGTAGTQQGFYRATSVRPEAITSAGIDYQIWKANVEPRAKLYDASNPDIDGFKARGGKLLIVQGTTDMLVPTAMTTRYVRPIWRPGTPQIRALLCRAGIRPRPRRL